jgi:hypothetical protein
MLNENDKIFLLNLARTAINEYIINDNIISPPKDTPIYLKEKMGAFVTLNKNNTLRGCIGYSEPFKPLVQAIIDVAIAAASSDPRFNKVKVDELDNIKLEISVLTKPKLIIVDKPQEYLNKIVVGKHGLIVEKGIFKGLLLPQVPIEWNWDVEEFLCQTCVKAGLMDDAWFDEDVKIYTFQAIVFKE